MAAACYVGRGEGEGGEGRGRGRGICGNWTGDKF
jgi:hypothetical protein